MLFVRALWRGPAEEKDFFLACLAAFPIVLFTLVAFWSSGRILPHWVAPGLSHAVSSARPRDRRADGGGLAVAAPGPDRRRRRSWSRASGIVAALPHLPLAFLSGPRDPLLETQDWDDFTRALDARGWRKPTLFVAATRWLDAGKLDYALHGDPPVLCLSDDPRGFGIIRDPQDFIGRDALIVAPKLSLDEARARLGRHFDAIEPLAPVEIRAGGAPAIVLQVFRGDQFPRSRAGVFAESPGVLRNPPRRPN